MRLFNYNTDISKLIIQQKIRPNMVLVDCTIGNGHDSLFLIWQTPHSKLYGFDIQKIALDNTKTLLKANKLNNNVQLVLDSHEHIDEYIHEPVDIFMYNLGYLPKQDKSITTTTKSTLKSLKIALSLLNTHGLIAIMAYPGHQEGKKEYDAIDQWLRSLDQKHFNVLKNDFINQKNNPPTSFIIEKKQ